MNEDKNKQSPKPPNFWELYEFPEDQQMTYSDCHFIQHSGREIVMVLGRMDPPRKKPISVSKVIMSPLHAQELVMNLQNQIKLLKNQGQPPSDNPPKRT